MGYYQICAIFGLIFAILSILINVLGETIFKQCDYDLDKMGSKNNVLLWLMILCVIAFFYFAGVVVVPFLDNFGD